MNTNKRANKVTVKVEYGVMIARFWKTHSMIAEVSTVEAMEQGYVVDDRHSSTTQREIFRMWVCDNSALFGIDYDPEDRRAEGNQFPNRYDSDELLMKWSCMMVGGQLQEWVSKLSEECGLKLEYVCIDVDDIVPVSLTNNGKEVSPKYKNGAWAWAKIPVTATIRLGNIEGYVTVNLELASGQLKKPTKIGSNGYNYTSLKSELAIDIPAINTAIENLKANSKTVIREPEVAKKEDLPKDENTEIFKSSSNVTNKDGETWEQAEAIGTWKDGSPKKKGFKKDGTPSK